MDAGLRPLLARRDVAAGFQFAFVCSQWFAGRKSFPRSHRCREPDAWNAASRSRTRACRRPRAAVRRPPARALLGRAISAISDSHSRAFDAEGGLDMRRRDFWESMATGLLVIGWRNQRVARIQIFRNRIPLNRRSSRGCAFGSGCQSIFVQTGYRPRGEFVLASTDPPMDIPIGWNTIISIL
jgi:hypothetical protein